MSKHIPQETSLTILFCPRNKSTRRFDLKTICRPTQRLVFSLAEKGTTKGLTNQFDLQTNFFDLKVVGAIKMTSWAGAKYFVTEVLKTN